MADFYNMTLRLKVKVRGGTTKEEIDSLQDAAGEGASKAIAMMSADILGAVCMDIEGDSECYASD